MVIGPDAMSEQRAGEGDVLERAWTLKDSIQSVLYRLENEEIDPDLSGLQLRTFRSSLEDIINEVDRRLENLHF